MKIKCVCGAEGFLQERGHSFRVQHYRGFKNRKRVYEYHPLPSGYFQLMEVNDGSKKPLSEPICRNGASGGIRTRDPRLTKAEPHRARLPRLICIYY